MALPVAPHRDREGRKRFQPERNRRAALVERRNCRDLDRLAASLASVHAASSHDGIGHTAARELPPYDVDTIRLKGIHCHLSAQIILVALRQDYLLRKRLAAICGSPELNLGIHVIV